MRIDRCDLVMGMMLIALFGCVQAADPVRVYNTNGSTNESSWTLLIGTPTLGTDAATLRNIVIQNGLIRVTYPCQLGSSDQRAGHLVYLKLGGVYTIAQDPQFGDWSYLGGSFNTNPTGFKITENSDSVVHIEMAFANHTMNAEDNSANPTTKHVIVQRGHYGYIARFDAKTTSHGEREIGFGCTKTHYFDYTTKWGYLFSATNSAPGGQNYEFIRRADDSTASHWWAAGLAFNNSYYRLVALKTQGTHSPALRAFSFVGGCT